MAQKKTAGLPKTEILPLCCGTSELLHPAGMGGCRGEGVSVGSKGVYGQRIKKEIAEATERHESSHFCNVTVVAAGEVHGEQTSARAGLVVCCLLPPLLEAALAWRHL